MKKKILEAIRKAERKNGVKIIWAIESGSRAWGFASEDSDYDVRCMHIGLAEDYLGLDQPPKQINLVEGEIDLESWDIKKFAELSIKSNPQIAEWLRSPVIYVDSPVREQFKKYFDAGCSLEFLGQHYIRMAKQNYHKYMGVGMAHSCKKYLYVLRGIACAIYVKKEKKLPPLPYKDVIKYLPGYVRRFFEECVVNKNATEKAKIIADERTLKFIDKHLSSKLNRVDRRFKKDEELNRYLIKTIKAKIK